MRAFLALLAASVSMWCTGQMFIPHRQAISHTVDTRPPFFTNVLLWIDPSIITNSSGSALSSAPDSGPFSWSVTMNGTFCTFLTNQVNGRPSITLTNPGAGGFSGTYLSVSAGNNGPFRTNSSYYSFLVIKPSGNANFGGEQALQTISAQDPVVYSGVLLGDALRDQNTGRMSFTYYANNAVYDCGLSSVNWTNNWVILDVHSKTNDWALYVNNQLQFSTNVNTVSCGNGSGGQSVNLGVAFQNSGNPIRYFSGMIAEVLMYKDLPDRLAVYNWFTNRYHLP